MNLQYIDIDKLSIPYEFSITIESDTYDFIIDYNSYGDFFTLEIQYEGIIQRKEKLIYGKPLFLETQYHPLAPLFMIIPYSVTKDVKEITYENFNEEVFLYIFDTDYIEEVLPDE